MEMDTPQLLPDNILQKQICQECFQYLSVPPITINRLGEKKCGRCLDASDLKKYRRSYFNTISERFLFKCTNHFDGCTKVVSLSETAEHEEMCGYEKRECLFCSFSGNLSQILNHSVKFHPENVSLDGKISFFLDDKLFQSEVLMMLNKSIFRVYFNLTEDFVTVAIIPLSNPPVPTSNQYGIRFFKCDDLTNVDYIHTDYGLLNESMETYFQKSKEMLGSVFGLRIQLTCEILLQQFSLCEKELEFKHRFAIVRHLEEQNNIFKRELRDRAQKLSQHDEGYNAALNVIKKLSYDLFKCHSCQKIILEDTYFCPKNHCYCKSCIKNTCKLCNSIQEFKKLEEFEKFLIPCDWQGCNESLRFKDYLKHKNLCPQRPYKCPLLNCHELVVSSEKLVEHWHCVVPELIEGGEIVCKSYMEVEYYWLIRNNLYHIHINFDDEIILVLLNEINVLPNNTCFKCEGFIDPEWSEIKSSKLGGKLQVYQPNSKITITKLKKKRPRVFSPLENIRYVEANRYEEYEEELKTNSKYSSLLISYS